MALYKNTEAKQDLDIEKPLLTQAEKFIEENYYAIDLKKTATWFFANPARSALHDIISIIVRQTGPAHVFASSMGISPQAARAMLQLNEMKYFKSVKLLFNYAKKHSYYPGFNLVSEVFNVKHANIHAKIAIIENEKYKVCFMGSFNMSQCNNIEAGCISTDPVVFNYYKKVLNDVFEQN